MDQKERTIVYGLVAACIAGIVLVGLLLIFVGGTIFSGEGFSEVSFLESEKLPNIVEEGKPIDFSFRVASHNNEKMDYTYNIIAGDTIIQSGKFSLPNDEITQNSQYNKTIAITNIKLNSTLIKFDNPTISDTQLSYNGGLGLLLSPDGSGAQVMSDPSYLYYPVQLPEGKERATLILNPKDTETFRTTTTSRTKVGNLQEISQTKDGIEIDGFKSSTTGYDISQSEWVIQNNNGFINASSKTITEKYRYAYEKISVEVNAYPANDPNTITKYEIHFWVVVSDGIQQRSNY